ncbi:MAG: MBL fold metallo-hydrolase [Bacteroidota bacterium]
MKLHHIRNATMVIEVDDIAILVDPMLGPKGSQAPFTLFRYPPRQNPIIPLPEGAVDLLDKVNHCVITHRHPDHIDRDGQQFLIERNIPVLCSQHDYDLFRSRGLYVTHAVQAGQEEPYLGGKAIGVEARHGYGWVARLMGKVMGYYLEFPNCPSIYLSSDTIFTEQVAQAIHDYQPDLCVFAAGMARLDVGEPLLMNIEDMIRFVKASPKQAIANHLEAVNHCPVTRQELSRALQKEGVRQKVWIPEDGESRVFD